MLIFDSFPTLDHAERFAANTRTEFGKAATVCQTREHFDTLDAFPFELHLPIVAVERDDLETETRIESSVTQFQGRFAGT